MMHIWFVRFFWCAENELYMQEVWNIISCNYAIDCDCEQMSDRHYWDSISQTLEFALDYLFIVTLRGKNSHHKMREESDTANYWRFFLKVLVFFSAGS